MTSVLGMMLQHREFTREVRKVAEKYEKIGDFPEEIVSMIEFRDTIFVATKTGVYVLQEVVGGSAGKGDSYWKKVNFEKETTGESDGRLRPRSWEKLNFE